MLTKLAKYSLKVLPDAPAAAVTRALAGRLQPLPITSAETAALAAATKVHLDGAQNIPCWGWGSGPAIVFIHGWGGRAAQMAPLAQYIIARQFKLSWQDLKSGAAFRAVDAELLLVYETADRIVPHSEGDRIRALCSSARLIKTDGYTHQTVLSAPELRVATEQFLKSRAC